MYPFRTSLFIVLTSAYAAAQTQPAAPPGDPVHLDHFTVTASPYSRHQTELAQPTSVLAGRDLLLNQSSSLGELLSGQPGVSSTYFGPGASRPVIRGLSGDRIRMLTDGVGTIDASIISPDHAVSLDPLLVESVEVVRGPATLLYGGSAVGGVVNVIDHRIHTTKPAAVFNARIEARAASGNGEESGGAVIEGGTGMFAWHVDGYRRNAGNVEIPGFAESAGLRAAESAEAAQRGEPAPAETAGSIANTALTAAGGALGFSFIGTPGYLGFAYSGHNTLYGVPGDAHQHGTEAEGPVRIHLHQRRIDARGAITQPLGIFNEVRFKLGAAQYRHRELEGEEIGTVFRNRGFDGRFELLHRAVGPFSGAFGWQGAESDFEAIGAEAFVPPSLTTTNSLFLFEEATLQPLTWQLGARLERQGIALEDGSSLTRKETVMSASTGMVWNLDEAWTLSLSLAHAERAPNAQELFAKGAHIGTKAYELGDAGLKPEKSLALDLTLRRRAGFVTGSLTVFANQFRGFIFEQPSGLIAIEGEDGYQLVSPTDPAAIDGGLAVFNFAQQDARFYGGELETVVHLLHTAGQQLDVTLGADLVRARNTSDDTNLPRITPVRFKTGVAWTKGLYSIGGDVQWVSHQRHVAPHETPTAGYTLVSAYASYRLTVRQLIFDLYVRGANLGDEEARMHTSFLKEVAPLPGRSITVGLRTSF